MPTIIPGDAPDCEVYGESLSGTLSELATDLSGWATDLTVATDVITEAASQRANITGRRTIDLRVEMDNGDTGYVYRFGTVDIIITTGTVACRANGAAAVSHTIIDIGGSVEDFLISWSTEPNPLTTGAGDAMRSELWISNMTNGTWEASFGTHAVQASQGAAAMTWGGRTTGSSIFTGIIYAYRLSRAFHSSTETAETFVADSAAPTLSGESRLEFPVPTRDTGIGDDGAFVGPVEVMAAKALDSLDLITASPIINELGAGEWGENSTWTMVDPDNAAYSMHFEYLRRRPIPTGINRVRIRAHVQQDGATPQELSLKAYCANGPGPLVTPTMSPMWYQVYSGTVERTADDGTATGAGAWVTIATLQIARDNYGHAWFWLGYDLGSLTDVRINAWTVESVVDLDSNTPGSGGGFGS